MKAYPLKTLFFLFIALVWTVGGCGSKYTKLDGAKNVSKTAKKSNSQNSGSDSHAATDDSTAGNSNSKLSRTPPPGSGALEPAVANEDGLGEFDSGNRLSMIHFDFDQYTLNSEARNTLDKNAQTIRKAGDSRVVIEGHCDERGTTEYNLALGERRASSAYNYLVDLGVDAGRLKAVSYGEEKPMDEAHNESAWAINRRVEFFAVAR